ncbi:MAG: DUF2828 family protein [Ruminococcus sp.]|nr:DUF2828 family protein [Ruminococcus sp.]
MTDYRDLLIEATNRTHTENGGIAYYSTLNSCLDLFASVGAMRGQDPARAKRMFLRAFSESPDCALKILFYARDIRGGIGERELFRSLIRELAFTAPESVSKNLHLIPEYGRYDDLLTLLDTPCASEALDHIKQQFCKDQLSMALGGPVSLLAKWMPSVNTSSWEKRELAKKLCRYLGLSEKKYRQSLSALRSYIDVLEKRLCTKDYSFDYSKLPSKALFNYRKAFFRNDKDRYEQFINAAAEGKEKLNTGTLAPYDIVKRCCEIRKAALYNLCGSIQEQDELINELNVLNTTWDALPDHTDKRNALAVIDVSGSMTAGYNSSIVPIYAAIALGIYLADKNKGFFAEHFMVFSRKARMLKLSEDTIVRKVDYILENSENENTDLADVFSVLLRTAVENQVPQSEMPEIIYLFSDMEFDSQRGSDKTVFENAKAEYAANGYKLPTVVFWTIEDRHGHYPVTMDETGAVLVSGTSPMIFSMIMNSDITPVKFMAQILDSERYRNICA